MEITECNEDAHAACTNLENSQIFSIFVRITLEKLE